MFKSREHRIEYWEIMIVHVIESVVRTRRVRRVGVILIGTRMCELLRLGPSSDSKLRRWIREIDVSWFRRLFTSRNCVDRK